MCECLWEVAEVLPARTDLLRVKPQMVCVSQEFLKQQLSPFQLTSARQALDVPKRTCSKAALPARKPIDMRAFCLIAMNKSIFDYSRFNRFHGRAPHRIDRANEQ